MQDCRCIWVGAAIFAPRKGVSKSVCFCARLSLVSDETLNPQPEYAVSRRTLITGAAIASALAAVADFVSAPSAQAAILWNHPLTPRGSVTHAWGEFWLNGKKYFHNGIDYSNGPSTTMPVYSVAAGTVTRATNTDSIYGTLVKINHGPNSTGGASWSSFYGHMVYGSFGSLSVGQTVSAATQVGIVGTTPSVARHLHVGLLEGSTQRNPGPVLSAAPLPGSPGVPITTPPPLSLYTVRNDNTMFLRYTSSAPNIWIAVDLSLIHI